MSTGFLRQTVSSLHSGWNDFHLPASCVLSYITSLLSSVQVAMCWTLRSMTPVQDQTLFRDMSKPHQQISGYSPIHLIPSFSAALNSELCLVRGKPLVSAWVQPTRSTVRKMPNTESQAEAHYMCFSSLKNYSLALPVYQFLKAVTLFFQVLQLFISGANVKNKYLSHSWIQKYNTS